MLAQKLPGRWRVLDHHAPMTTTESSLQRARQRPPQTWAEAVPHDAWPLVDGGTDAVFAILAIHELREPAQLAAWFREARRCLAPGGRVVLVEHCRDLANFLAFGPGFRHFHAPRTWQRAWQTAGLGCREEFRITPFLRVSVLTAP
jgi:SAM-dependent methyltransferase